MSDAPIPNSPSRALPPVRSSNEAVKLTEAAAGIARKFSSGQPKTGTRKRKKGRADPDLFEDQHSSNEAAPMTVTGSMSLGELSRVLSTDKDRKIERVDEDGWSAREVLSKPSDKPKKKRTGAGLAASALKKLRTKF